MKNYSSLRAKIFLSFTKYGSLFFILFAPRVLKKFWKHEVFIFIKGFNILLSISAFLSLYCERNGLSCLFFLLSILALSVSIKIVKITKMNFFINFLTLLINFALTQGLFDRR